MHGPWQACVRQLGAFYIPPLLLSSELCGIAGTPILQTEEHIN